MCEYATPYMCVYMCTCMCIYIYIYVRTNRLRASRRRQFKLHAMFIELETLLSLFSFYRVPSPPPFLPLLLLPPLFLARGWLLLPTMLKEILSGVTGPPLYELPVFGVGRGRGGGDPLVSVFREKVPFAIFNSTTASAEPSAVYASILDDTRRYCLLHLHPRHFYSEDSGEPSFWRKFNKRATFVSCSHRFPFPFLVRSSISNPGFGFSRMLL